mmetsp:Transcript_6398/g.19356  ORF Transcript_6398/g.19356 Transcript_6398/m.19356 type:complete len:269 (-) Transcript_6398:156-962(-)
MQRQVADSLLRDDNVRVKSEQVVADLLDVLLLQLKQPLPVLLLVDLYIGGTLAFSVLEWTVEQYDFWLLNVSSHAAKDNILVEHDSLEHFALGEVSSGNLFDLCKVFEVDRRPVAVVDLDSLDCVNGNAYHEVAVSADILGSYAAGHDLFELSRFLCVDRLRELLCKLDCIVQGPKEGVDNHGRVEVSLEKLLRERQQLASQNTHRSSSIAHLLVLGLGELDHALSSRMVHIDLPQNCIPIVGEHDAARGVKDHLEHRPRSQSRSNDV